MNVTMSESPHPIIQARRAQMFPTLAPADIDRLRRFGETRSYGLGERIIRAGDAIVPLPLLFGPTKRKAFCCPVSPVRQYPSASSRVAHVLAVSDAARTPVRSPRRRARRAGSPPAPAPPRFAHQCSTTPAAGGACRSPRRRARLAGSPPAPAPPRPQQREEL